MSFSSEEVELLVQIARDASLGHSFATRIDAVSDALSVLIPHSAFSAIVLDLERRRETPPGQIFYKNGKLEDLIPYTSHYIKDDPMFPAIPRGDGKSYVLSDFVPRRRFGRDAFTSDYLKLLNVRHVMGCSHYMPSGQLLTLAFHRDKGLADFSTKEREVLRLASPDILRAAWGGLLEERVAELSTARADAPSGAIVYTAEGQIAHSDERGVRLAAAVGSSVGPDALAKQVAKLASVPSLEGTTSQYTFRLGDGRWIHVRLSKLRGGPGASVLAVFDVLVPGSPELRMALMDEGELTPRERDVASLAAQGRGNREIALQLGISAATVNVHLQRVYGKLGVPGRGELAMLLHSGAH